METVDVVKVLPVKIWSEKDMFGTVNIKVQHEGHEAFSLIQINYDYRYTSNAHQHKLTQRILAMLGAEVLPNVQGHEYHRESLGDAIVDLLRSHRLTHTHGDDNSGGYPLVDALTPHDAESITLGLEEIELLAGEIAWLVIPAEVSNVQVVSKRKRFQGVSECLS